MTTFNDIVRRVSEVTPDFNDYALRGFVEENINNSPEFLAMVFREGFKVVDDDIELVGFKILSPEERAAFELKSGQSESKRTKVPITTSHMVLVRYTVRHRNEYITREIYTPYLYNGMLMINDKWSMIKKVILEKTFSRVQDKGVDGISVSPIRVNIKFNRRHTLRIESYTSKDFYTHFIVTGELWHGDKRRRVCERTILHYLLAKFGFEKTMRRFGISKADISFVPEIDESTTNKFEYFAARKFTDVEKGPGLFLKVNRQLLTDDQSLKLVVNLVYVLKDFDIQNMDNVYVEEGSVWRVILGILILDERDPLRAYNNTMTHLRSVDTFIDPLTLTRFRSFGLMTGENEDIYDLLVHIFVNIDAFMAQYEAQDIYNCRIDMSNILVETFARKVFSNIYQLGRKTNITHKDVKDALRLSATMFKFNSSGRKDNSEQYLSPPDIVGDNYLFSGGLNKLRLNGKPEQRLHPSMAVAESIEAFVGKPIGKTGYLNPYVPTSPLGAIEHPDYASDVDQILPYIPR